MNLLISCPKAGTHMFGNMLNADLDIIALYPKPQKYPIDQFLPNETILERLQGLDASQNYKGHIPYIGDLTNRFHEFDHVFLALRDPRDVIVSMAHYVDRVKTSAFNHPVFDGRLSELYFPYRIDYLIETMRPVFELFEGWRKEGIEVLCYEEYKYRPDQMVQKLSRLGFGTVEEISKRAQKRAYTFRNGTSGQWEKEFTDGQKERANMKFGDLIEAWRY